MFQFFTKNSAVRMLFSFQLETIIILTVAVLLTNIVVILSGSGNPRVKTSLGIFEGFKYENKDGSISNIFLGIRYARAPVGTLRFEKPVNYSGSHRILKTKAFPPACFPVHRASFDKHSEDCLFLNIVAPAKKPTKKQGYPVLVFIHGGGFVFGGTEQFGYKSFSEHFASYGIIVVTIQYRVGILGFFTTGDSVLPGNNGLWDQTHALIVLHEILPDFGGNPLDITVWGNSAGAASVHALSISPHSKFLFRRGIQSSGSLFAHWALNKGVLSNSVKLAKLLKCSGNNSIAVRDCIKNKTISEILEAGIEMEDLTVSTGREFTFNPWVDGLFFQKPLKYESNVTILFGLADKEESSVEINLFKKVSAKCWSTEYGIDIDVKESEDCSKSELKRFIKEIIVPETSNITIAVEDLIYEHFVARNSAEIKTNSKKWLVNTAVDIMSDMNFFLPVIRQIRQSTRLNQTSYLFYQKYYRAMPNSLVQECHLFRTPYSNGMKWPNINTDNGKYIVLNPHAYVERKFEHDRMEFWTCELPRKISLDILYKIQLLYPELHKEILTK